MFGKLTVYFFYYYSFSISPGDSISIIYSCLGYNKAERIIPSAQADMRLNVQMNYTSFDLGKYLPSGTSYLYVQAHIGLRYVQLYYIPDKSK
ncbi:hypothetical protein CF162_24015 [Parabacteroides distasonis]|nr:hypothetical protein CF162_24015 [Parabacteroides distasonis]